LIGKDTRRRSGNNGAARSKKHIGTVSDTVRFSSIDAVASHITISKRLSRNTVLNRGTSGRRSAGSVGGNDNFLVVSAVVTIQIAHVLVRFAITSTNRWSISATIRNAFTSSTMGLVIHHTLFVRSAFNSIARADRFATTVIGKSTRSVANITPRTWELRRTSINGSPITTSLTGGSNVAVVANITNLTVVPRANSALLITNDLITAVGIFGISSRNQSAASSRLELHGRAGINATQIHPISRASADRTAVLGLCTRSADLALLHLTTIWPNFGARSINIFATLFGRGKESTSGHTKPFLAHASA